MVLVARWISILGHPFVWLPLAVAWSTLPHLGASGVGLLLALMAIPMVAISILVVRNVRRGVWTNVDVSVREHRPRMYLLAIALTALMALLAAVLGLPDGIVRGMGVSFGLLSVLAITNQWLKVSAHAAYAWLTAGVLATAAPVAGLLGVVVAALVSGSRIVLGRHTALEVVIGSLLGGVAGALLATG